MAIKRSAPAHENDERWLVSYADFITLLFAFFVVMFASTQADKEKAKQVSESVRQALEHGEFSNAISTVLGRGKYQAAHAPKTNVQAEHEEPQTAPPPPPPAPPAHPADLSKSLDTLQHGLANELSSGKVGLKLEKRGLVISLRESAFFASGDDAISATSLPMVSKIAVEIQGLTNP